MSPPGWHDRSGWGRASRGAGAMDLRYTAAELAFRDELRAFFHDNLPGDIRERMRLGHMPSKDDIVRWQRILNQRGWAAYSWPKEHGGPGRLSWKKARS